MVVRRFKERLLAHVAEHFPQQSQRLGREQLLRVIGEALRKARAHGFTTERDACLYLSLVLRLGGGFDQDPQLPWAKLLLQDLSSPAATRIERLYDIATRYLRSVIGEHGERLLAVLRRLESEPLAAWSLPPAGDFEEALIRSFQDLHREKCEAVGRDNLVRLIQWGGEAARSHGITEAAGLRIYIGSMFLLGSGFATDPQFPWASEALRDGPGVDGNTKASRLYQAGLAELRERLPLEGSRKG